MKNAIGKKTVSVMGCAALVLVLGVSSQASVITNADFEQDPSTGWSINDPDGKGLSMEQSVGGGPDGSNCVKVTKTGWGSQPGIRSDFFAVEAEIDDQGYDLSFWDKGELTEWTWLSASIEYFDASYSWLGYATFGGHQNTSWEQHTYHLDSVLGGTAYARLSLRIDEGSGTGYFDKVRFGAVPEPATMCLLALGGLGVLLRRKR